MSIEMVVANNLYRATALLHDTEIMSNEAKTVLAFIEKWGMIQGKEDGEDSSGRAKMGLMPVEKVVDRAMEMADVAFNRLRERGWIVEGLTWDEIQYLSKTAEEGGTGGSLERLKSSLRGEV